MVSSDNLVVPIPLQRLTFERCDISSICFQCLILLRVVHQAGSDDEGHLVVFSETTLALTEKGLFDAPEMRTRRMHRILTSKSLWNVHTQSCY